MAKWISERDGEIQWGKEKVAEYCVEMGYSYEFRNPDAPVYQIAVIRGDGFAMVAYPHKTSAGNHHIRLRDQGSKDKIAYAKAVEGWFKKSGYNCSFQAKHMSTLENTLRIDRKASK